MLKMIPLTNPDPKHVPTWFLIDTLLDDDGQNPEDSVAMVPMKILVDQFCQKKVESYIKAGRGRFCYPDLDKNTHKKD